MSILKKLTENQRFIYEVMTDYDKFRLTYTGQYYTCEMLSKDRTVVISLPVKIETKDIEDLCQMIPDIRIGNYCL